MKGSPLRRSGLIENIGEAVGADLIVWVQVLAAIAVAVFGHEGSIARLGRGNLVMHRGLCYHLFDNSSCYIVTDKA
jgi:hypothetical protein